MPRRRGLCLGDTGRLKSESAGRRRWKCSLRAPRRSRASTGRQYRMYASQSRRYRRRGGGRRRGRPWTMSHQATQRKGSMERHARKLLVAAATIVLVTSGFQQGAFARILEGVRIVQWQMPLPAFVRKSVAPLLRPLDLGMPSSTAVPRYRQFRNDLVRTWTSSSREWYVIPLSDDAALCGDAGVRCIVVCPLTGKGPRITSSSGCRQGELRPNGSAP